MVKEFRQIVWDAELEADWSAILDLAIREDLGRTGDCTTQALVCPDVPGTAAVVARQAGRLAGITAAQMVVARIDPNAKWRAEWSDGDSLSPGQTIARIEGPAASILAAERILLNVMGHLSGIASLTQQYVAAVAGTRARIYDTRKTTPGWRKMEKFAVRCGGGWNHRGGLYEAILIKDNHLALGLQATKAGAAAYRPGDAVLRARQFAAQPAAGGTSGEMIVEVEVDTLEQLREVLAVAPDIVLLDNMAPSELRAAVEIRNSLATNVELEASGGVNLQTVRAIAESGVDRISVGALTHSVPALDIGLDWLPRNSR